MNMHTPPPAPTGVKRRAVDKALLRIERRAVDKALLRVERAVADFHRDGFFNEVSHNIRDSAVGVSEAQLRSLLRAHAKENKMPFIVHRRIVRTMKSGEKIDNVVFDIPRSKATEPLISRLSLACQVLAPQGHGWEKPPAKCNTYIKMSKTVLYMNLDCVNEDPKALGVYEMVLRLLCSDAKTRQAFNLPRG